MRKKTIKHYDFKLKPKKPSKFWMTIARWFAINPRLRPYKYVVRKINMEGIKPPYLLFATHASMLDFPLMYKAIEPYSANNVVAIDAVRDIGDGLMRKLGCICKRKFVRDPSLIRNIHYSLNDLKDIVCIYPEARYTLDGTTQFLPTSLGKMSKYANVPIVVLRMYGTYLASPQWNKPEQIVPLAAELECIATAEEASALSPQELNERIFKAMQRDDYEYQRKNSIELNYEKRADGLHNILYQCPHCSAEFKMYSEGTRLWCASCGKGWQVSKLNTLSAEEGETEYEYIPDWVKWERENIRAEVRSGSYRFEGEVTVHTLPNAKRFYDQGTGKLVQTPEGTRLTCTAYGEEKELFWTAQELESVHIEYDYPFRKDKYKKNIFGDCIDISELNDSYWLHPVGKRDQLTKFSIATEEIYRYAIERMREKD